MDCCTGDHPCPMHQTESDRSGATRVVTQAQADSCCALSEQEQSGQSTQAFAAPTPAADLGAGIVVPPATPRLVLTDSWRTSAPVPSPPAPQARPALRLPPLAHDSTRASCRPVAAGVLCARDHPRRGLSSMINRLIELSLRHRFIVIALSVALAGWGWWAVSATPIDAIPDLSDNQVIVFTDWTGHSPAGGRGPGHLSADGEPAGPGRCARGAIAVGLRLLDDLRGLRGRRRSVLRARARAGTPESGGQEPARRRRPDARAGRHGRRARLLVHAREPDACRSGICAACRTGSSATSSTPCLASPKSRRSAASCSSTRSTSTRTASASTALPLSAVVVGRARQQPERRRQRPGVERRLARSCAASG